MHGDQDWFKGGLRMNKTKELDPNILTVFEMKALYGNEFLDFMKQLYGNVFPIVTAADYRLFIQMFSYHRFLIGGREIYSEILDTYSQDLKTRFGKSIDTINNGIEALLLSNNQPLWMFNKNEYSIKNVSLVPFIDKGVGWYEFSKEIYLEDCLYEAFWNWDEDIEIKRQVKVKSGKIDLTLETNERLVIIELKKAKINGRALYQAFDYMFSYPDDYSKKIEMVVIGSEFSEHALRVAKKLGITCISYKVHELKNTSQLVIDFEYMYKTNESVTFNNFMYEVTTETTGHENSIWIDHPCFMKTFKEYASEKLKEYKEHNNFMDVLLEQVQEYVNKHNLNQIISIEGDGEESC